MHAIAVTAVVLASVVLPVLTTSTAKAGRLDPVLSGKTIYARVCLHSEYKDASFKAASTNFLGLPQKFTVGSEFKVLEVDGDTFVLIDKSSGKEVRIDFVERHNRMPALQWFEENFSREPVRLPDSLTASERKAVKNCEGREGLSRKALYLAVGFPPASLTPSRESNTLTYQLKRFDKIQYILDEDKVVAVRD